MAKSKSTTASGKNYLNLSLNPFPAVYRHQNGTKQIVTKGHEGQTDHEIIITMPQESGTLAVIDGGGTIDLSNYYTKAEVNALLGDKDIELQADYYSKVEVDSLILDITDNNGVLSDRIDDLGIVVGEHTKDIETLQNDVIQNSAGILTNKTAHEKNASDISKNKTDIAKNKTAIGNNTTQIQDLKRRQPIITLWKVGTPLSGAYGNDPAKGEMYMGNGTQVTNNFRDVTELYINFQDYDGQGHTFAQTKVGEIVDIVDGDENKNFGRYTIVSKEAKLDSEKIVVELVSASGTTKVTDILALQELPVIDGGAVMMKDGGVFTGNVATNKGSISITSNETTDGNSFDVSNGNGDLHLTVTGDGNFNYYKPADLVQDDNTVATMGDLGGGNELASFSSNGTGYRYVTGSINTYNFTVDYVDPKYVKYFTAYKMYTLNGSLIYLKDYILTPTTTIEVYEENTGYLMFKSLVASQEIVNGDVKYRLTGNKPSVWHSGKNFTTSGYYSIMIQNLTKK